MQLIIAEKPSVARDIARVLGAKTKRDGYLEGKHHRVSWCFGHMVQLAEPARYDDAWKRWSANTLPMLPEPFKLVGIGSSRDHLKILKTLMHDPAITSIINACDAGREGELIFRYVYEIVKCKKPVERLWLASMTDAAITQGFKHLKPGLDYDALYDAARCRSEADWLVGLNATRAMTIRCRQQGTSELMSIGRVQTPTLAMIVTREQEIEAFVPETFWQVYATFDAGEQPEGVEPRYEGVWTRKKVDRLDKKEDAEAILKAIEGQPAQVIKTEHKEVKERPPQLFDLTSLQREANQRHGYSAQQTLDIAQALYEKHKLITYPRTDSNYLTTDMKKGLEGIVRAIDIPPYSPFCQHLLANTPLPVSKRIVDDNEVGDHHAIIPTDKTPDLKRLSDQEEKIYDLIARRFLAVFYPDAIFATTKIATAVCDKKHVFLTTGKVRKSAGWQEVEPPPKWRNEANKTQSKDDKGKKGNKKEESSGGPILPNVEKGDAVQVVDQRLHEGSTQPPRRYSESALLGAMERAGNQLDDAEMRRVMKESGLGTPATRASIIETLLKREYISRKGKVLVPTPKGRVLIEAIPSDELRSAALTGAWEAKLTQVAGEKMSREDFMTQARALTRELTRTLLTQALELPQGLSPGGGGGGPGAMDGGEVLGTCPICQREVREGRAAFSCATGRDCSFVIFKQVAGRTISPTLVKVLLSGKTTKTLKGFKSKQKKPFEAALKLDEEGKVTFVFDQRDDAREDARDDSPPPPRRAPREQAPSAEAPRAAASSAPRESSRRMNLMCPMCEEGEVVRGKRAWGCSRWREGCRFTIAYEQCGVTLDDEQGAALLRFGQIGPLDALHGGRLLLDLEREGNIHFIPHAPDEPLTP